VFKNLTACAIRPIAPWVQLTTALAVVSIELFVSISRSLVGRAETSGALGNLMSVSWMTGRCRRCSRNVVKLFQLELEG
jgi:hypothetical protein